MRRTPARSGRPGGDAVNEASAALEARGACKVYRAGTPAEVRALDGIDLASSGIPTEEAYVAAYCRRTGREKIEDFSFYLGFSIFRLASIGQGVFKRNLDGIGNSDASPDNSGTRLLAETAWAVLQR